ncbi:MAG: type IX secretion system sortase PorU [Ignavibacteria bacterium]|nr:type IX secretion system sortase PorU [Ignavibacteria bacterium]
MNTIKILLTFILTANLFSQNKKQVSEDYDRSGDVNESLFEELFTDYRVISSTNTHIEIEYILPPVSKQEIYFNGERLHLYIFAGGTSKGISFSGTPDVRSRSFAVFVPSFRNSIEVLDYDVKEISGVNLAPIPTLNVINPSQRSFENIFYTYPKNSDYSQNKFFPEKPAEFVNISRIRDLLAGNLVISPLQYNPVTGVLKVYSRIRVRINFGDPPQLLSKPRTRSEVSLLSGAALNSDLALGWTFNDPGFKTSSVSNSVLASGNWYKIEIRDNDNAQSEGIYRLTKSFMESAGINFSGVDPRTIKMYGNGGDMLPDRMHEPRPSDLEEIAIYVEGEADGSFDAQDFILFYGRSINNWAYDSVSNKYYHYLNVYSRSNYYWLCINKPGNGKRIQLVNSENGTPSLTPTSFTEKIFTEPEQANLINEGNVWLSIRKNPGQSFEWNTTLTGIEAGSDILYRIKMASRCISPNTNYFIVKDEFSNMSDYFLPMGQVYIGFGDWIATNIPPAEFTINQSQKTNGEQVRLKATYMATSSAAEGYLDWFEIQYKRRLNSVNGDYLRFDSPDYTGLVEYNVGSFSNSNVRIFDATDHANVKLIQPLSVSASNVRFQKTETINNISRFLAVGQNGYKTPNSISQRIPNQNLRGISEGFDFIIITHRDFIQSAERLKSKRERKGINDPDYLKSLVVTTDQIYNEFSGGVLDAVAIRDFIKYAYENWKNPPTHVCLLGDGSFDYKNILGYNSNFVPAWEKSSPTINQIDGLTTDDFYVNVTGENQLIGKPDLAVGRIPASSLQEAMEYLDKVDAYESGSSNGYWKNRMMFVADDQRTTEGCEFIQHLYQIETLAEAHLPQYLDKMKIYIVTYPTVITPQGRRKPQANLDIAKYWNDGVINVHYTGHGSPDVWAHEYILEKDVIMSLLNNQNRYPFVTIASCDMSKFDNPASLSAGELFMITPRKGAIGTLAATRPVFAEGNAYLMYNIFDNLYIPRDTLLLQKRYGDGIFNTKVQINYSENDAKFVLMADPSLRNQLPRFQSHIDSISGLSGDTMRALSRIKIYGSILKPDSSQWNDYNGKIMLRIYDVDRQITLRDECDITHSFRLNGGVIFSGIQTIRNGKWTVEFIVPRDISYMNQRGRLINYFFNNQYDGAGINRNFIVGGIDPNAPVDTVGPIINLYLNTRNFRSGDIVNENFRLIADLFDESGINTTGTIGHKLEAILDGDENNKYDLTNFYNSDSSYKSGTIEYDFRGIREGEHTLKLKAWDTYNNSSEVMVSFVVSSTGELKITNVYNYPNPFKDNTAFTFQHNYPGDINIRIKIYTVSGRLIKEIKPGLPISDKFVVINWDGKDEDGETLGNGIYIYKLVVETFDGISVTTTGKLAVLK